MKSNTKEKRKEIQSIDYKFKKENSLLFKKTHFSGIFKM